jgi:hypothetical protein
MMTITPKIVEFSDVVMKKKGDEKAQEVPTFKTWANKQLYKHFVKAGTRNATFPQQFNDYLPCLGYEPFSLEMSISYTKNVAQVSAYATPFDDESE